MPGEPQPNPQSGVTDLQNTINAIRTSFEGVGQVLRTLSTAVTQLNAKVTALDTASAGIPASDVSKNLSNISTYLKKLTPLFAKEMTDSLSTIGANVGSVMSSLKIQGSDKLISDRAEGVLAVFKELQKIYESIIVKKTTTSVGDKEATEAKYYFDDSNLVGKVTTGRSNFSKYLGELNKFFIVGGTDSLDYSPLTNNLKTLRLKNDDDDVLASTNVKNVLKELGKIYDSFYIKSANKYYFDKDISKQTEDGYTNFNGYLSELKKFFDDTLQYSDLQKDLVSLDLKKGEVLTSSNVKNVLKELQKIYDDFIVKKTTYDEDGKELSAIKYYFDNKDIVSSAASGYDNLTNYIDNIKKFFNASLYTGLGVTPEDLGLEFATTIKSGVNKGEPDVETVGTRLKNVFTSLGGIYSSIIKNKKEGEYYFGNTAGLNQIDISLNNLTACIEKIKNFLKPELYTGLDVSAESLGLVKKKTTKKKSAGTVAAALEEDTEEKDETVGANLKNIFGILSTVYDSIIKTKSSVDRITGEVKGAVYYFSDKTNITQLKTGAGNLKEYITNIKSKFLDKSLYEGLNVDLTSMGLMDTNPTLTGKILNDGTEESKTYTAADKIKAMFKILGGIYSVDLSKMSEKPKPFNSNNLVAKIKQVQKLAQKIDKMDFSKFNNLDTEGFKNFSEYIKNIQSIISTFFGNKTNKDTLNAAKKSLDNFVSFVTKTLMKQILEMNTKIAKNFNVLGLEDTTSKIKDTIQYIQDIIKIVLEINGVKLALSLTKGRVTIPQTLKSVQQIVGRTFACVAGLKEDIESYTSLETVSGMVEGVQKTTDTFADIIEIIYDLGSVKKLASLAKIRLLIPQTIKQVKIIISKITSFFAEIAEIDTKTQDTIKKLKEVTESTIGIVSSVASLCKSAIKYIAIITIGYKPFMLMLSLMETIVHKIALFYRYVKLKLSIFAGFDNTFVDPLARLKSVCKSIIGISGFIVILALIAAPTMLASLVASGLLFTLILFAKTLSLFIKTLRFNLSKTTLINMAIVTGVLALIVLGMYEITLSLVSMALMSVVVTLSLPGVLLYFLEILIVMLAVYGFCKVMVRFSKTISWQVAVVALCLVVVVASLLIIGLCLIGISTIATSVLGVLPKVLLFLLGMIVLVGALALFGAVAGLAMPALIAAALACVVVTVAVTAILLMAGALWLLQNIKLDTDKIKSTVDGVLQTIKYILGEIFGFSVNKPVGGNGGLIGGLLSLLFGPTASLLLNAIVSSAFLVISMLGILSILLVAGMLKILENIKLNKSKIEQVIGGVIDTCAFITKTVMTSTLNPMSSNSGGGVLGALISFVYPPLGGVVQAILSSAFLAINIFGVLSILLMAGMLRAIQAIGLDKGKIKEVISNVIDSCKIISACLSDTGEEDRSSKSDKGLLGSLIAFVYPPLESILSAIMSLAFLAVNIVNVLAMMCLTGLLNKLGSLDVNTEGVKKTVNDVMDMCNLITNKLTSTEKPEQKTSIFDQIFGWLNIPKVLSLLSGLGNLLMAFTVIGAVHKLAEQLSELSKIEIPEDISSKISTILGASNTLIDEMKKNSVGTLTASSTVDAFKQFLGLPAFPKELQGIEQAFMGAELMVKLADQLSKLNKLVGKIGDAQTNAQKILITTSDILSKIKEKTDSLGKVKPQDIEEALKKWYESVENTSKYTTKMVTPLNSLSALDISDIAEPDKITEKLTSITNNAVSLTYFEDIKTKSYKKSTDNASKLSGYIRTIVAKIKAIVLSLTSLSKLKDEPITVPTNLLSSIKTCVTDIQTAIGEPDAYKPIVDKINIWTTTISGMVISIGKTSSLFGKLSQQNINTQDISDLVNSINSSFEGLENSVWTPQSIDPKVKQINRLVNVFNKLRGFTSQDVKNSKDITENYIKFVDKINTSNLQALQTTEKMLLHWQKLSESLNGNFNGLAQSLNEHIMPALEKLNTTMAQVNEKLEEQTGVIETEHGKDRVNVVSVSDDKNVARGGKTSGNESQGQTQDKLFNEAEEIKKLQAAAKTRLAQNHSMSVADILLSGAGKIKTT